MTPPKTYTIDFKTLPEAVTAYEQFKTTSRLTDEMISKSEIDDGKVSFSEFIGAVVDQFSQHPDNKNYLKILDDLIRPYPLVLGSNGNSKVEAAIGKLNVELGRHHNGVGTKHYAENLAEGLFYFSLFSADSSLIQANQTSLKVFTSPLNKKVFGTFRESLFQKGGLGLGDLKENFTDHLLPVPETLKNGEPGGNRTGAPVDRVAALYTVYQKAGLNPQLGICIPKKGKANPLIVGVPVGQKGNLKYFDPNQSGCSEKSQGFRSMPIPEFLGLELFYQGYRLFHEYRNREQAIKILTYSTLLNPNDPRSFYQLGLLFMGKNEFRAANQVFKKAIALNPSYLEALISLGMSSIIIKEEGEGIEYLGKAMGIDPTAILSAVTAKVFTNEIVNKWIVKPDFQNFENDKKFTDNIAVTELKFLIFYIAWQGRQFRFVKKGGERDFISFLNQELDFKPELSSTTKGFLSHMIRIMPSSMMQDKEIERAVTQFSSKYKLGS